MSPVITRNGRKPTRILWEMRSRDRPRSGHRLHLEKRKARVRAMLCERNATADANKDLRSRQPEMANRLVGELQRPLPRRPRVMPESRASHVKSACCQWILSPDREKVKNKNKRAARKRVSAIGRRGYRQLGRFLQQRECAQFCAYHQTLPSVTT